MDLSPAEVDAIVLAALKKRGGIKVSTILEGENENFHVFYN